MAAKFRKVDPRIWIDERFRKLSPEDKLLAVYCLTCAQCNRIGLFHLSLAMASEAIGYPCHTLAMGIKRVCDTLRWRFDSDSGTLFFPTWWKYNGACGPKTMAGNLEDLHDVPQSELIQAFASETRYLSESEKAVLGRVCHTHAIPMPYPSAFGAQEQEQELEQEKEQEQDSGCAETLTDKVCSTLGATWTFHLKRTKNRVKADDPDDAQAILESLKPFGYTEDEIAAAITDKARDKTEHLWEFKKRLLAAKQGKGPANSVTLESELEKYNVVWK